MTASTQTELLRHRFTVEEYHRMGRGGILTEDDRVELIEGEVVEMTPIGSSHAGIVTRLTRLLVRRVGDAALVSPQNPLRLGEFSEPEPDLTLLRPRDDDYRHEHPGADDVLLVIEVGETSLVSDREVKVPLYARHGVPAVWLVNLPDATVEVYTDPTEDGYASTDVARDDDDLGVDGVPELLLTPGELFG